MHYFWELLGGKEIINEHKTTYENIKKQTRSVKKQEGITERMYKNIHSQNKK